MSEPRTNSKALTSMGDSVTPMSPDKVEAFVYDLLGSSLISGQAWERVTQVDREKLLGQTSREAALTMMVEMQLLTPFLASRVRTGNTFGLILGNFRLLERIGSGGMAIVYKAEHLEMGHFVAIKVLELAHGNDYDPRLESRFSAEMRIIARLRHPNIVAAIDAGRTWSADPNGPVLWYLVMEYVPGEDLNEYVRHRGPLPVSRACNLIQQIASALAETHKLNLVHRDIKPSNIIVTPEEQAKLLDFGLTRNKSTRVTQPGTILGTLDFMSPEQARDASQVDIRADIWSLGATLYWCLTGQLPFPGEGSDMELMMQRLSQEPPSIRVAQPELPDSLDRVVRKMMALKPEDRYQTPQEVLQALLPFLRRQSSIYGLPGDSKLSVSRELLNHSLPGGERIAPPRRVLVVDDEESLRNICREVLKIAGIEPEMAASGQEALEHIEKNCPDLVLLDVNMPGMSGLEVLRSLRAKPPVANLKVIMFSGQFSADEMSEMLRSGADDYLTKPFSVPQFRGRVEAALRLKEAQDQTDLLNHHLFALNEQLEHRLSDRDSDLLHVRSALIQGLARLAQLREETTSLHLERMPRYLRSLSEEAAKLPAFQLQIDPNFIDLVSSCSPLHDIGKVGLPDHILLKPGILLPDERMLMQTHTTIPERMLKQLVDENAGARVFLKFASDIIRHHHERYDGKGYPDGLARDNIPLAARLVAIGDVYDALRCRRPHKPALGHQAAVTVMEEMGRYHFDPELMVAFRSIADQFERIFRECPG
ncbi:MAG: protein kinase domain-containing protein [Gemmataceae bacterium]